VNLLHQRQSISKLHQNRSKTSKRQVRDALHSQLNIFVNVHHHLQSTLSIIPKFSIKGRLNRTKCPLSVPFTGELTVVSSEAKIRSIELQLVRVETIGKFAARTYIAPCSCELLVALVQHMLMAQLEKPLKFKICK
jgi:hypothetical protein